MARQLPGLYWDDDRQRYFPLASRPRQVQACRVPAPTDAVPIRHPATPLSNIRSALRSAHKDALIHRVRSSQISLTDKSTRSAMMIPQVGGLYSAFRTVSHSGRVWNFAGDTQGWFYLSVVDSDDGTFDGWQHQFYLSSEVSSIVVSGTTCIATSFGPECRILSVSLDSTSVDGMYTTRFDSRVVHDIWTADLQGSRLALGASKQAVLIEDIAVTPSIRRLPTKSDVLALAQHEDVLYTGLRDGGILRFDTRLEKSHIYPVFDGPSQRTSITGLEHMRNHQLLVSFIDGGISTFDLRFPIRMPLMTFSGNSNSYTTKLPLAIDPHEKFLFAAGQDKRIRLWSLVTGGPPIEPAGPTDQTLFQHPFEHRVAALQVIEEKEGMCLWAASGTEVCMYSLGQRSGIGMS